MAKMSVMEDFPLGLKNFNQHLLLDDFIVATRSGRPSNWQAL
jgi:hypothetical protein